MVNIAFLSCFLFLFVSMSIRAPSHWNIDVNWNSTDHMSCSVHTFSLFLALICLAQHLSSFLSLSLYLSKFPQFVFNFLFLYVYSWNVFLFYYILYLYEHVFGTSHPKCKRSTLAELCKYKTHYVSGSLCS